MVHCNDSHFNTCIDHSAPFPFFVSSVVEFLVTLLQCIVILYKWWPKWLSNSGNFEAPGCYPHTTTMTVEIEVIPSVYGNVDCILKFISGGSRGGA